MYTGKYPWGGVFVQLTCYRQVKHCNGVTTISPYNRLLLRGALQSLGVLGAGVPPGYSAKLAKAIHLLHDRKEDVSL